MKKFANFQLRSLLGAAITGIVIHSQMAQAALSIQHDCFQYAGACSDNKNLQYLNARYYDVVLMRFVSKDTDKRFINDYAYASGNPVMNLDPSGHFSELLGVMADELYPEEEVAASALSTKKPWLEMWDSENAPRLLGGSNTGEKITEEKEMQTFNSRETKCVAKFFG